MQNVKHKLFIVLTLIFGTLLIFGGMARGADVTINTDMTFAAADASDGMTDGTFTVTGNLTIIGSGSIQSNGGDINIVVDGNCTMEAGALISSMDGVPGDINIAVTGDIDLQPNSIVTASTAGYSAGAIVITSLGNVDIDGYVLSTSTLSGTGANQAPGGGPITIKASCELIITDDGIVRSKGSDPGADLVHLEACDVVIYGLVESTGVGHAVPNHPVNHLNSTYRPDKPAQSTAGVEVWASTLVIDGVNHNGQINADLTKGEDNRSWIDLYASSNITIISKTSGTKFTVHANNAGNGAMGGLITVKSVSGKITANGFALQADADVAGGDGGQIIIEAFSDVKLDDAQIIARGDYVPTIGKGGIVTIRSYKTLISWQDTAIGVIATGDVRPTGALVPLAKRGVITFQKCTPGAVNVAGTVFPNGNPVGAATTPTTLGDSCDDVPLNFMPDYFIPPNCSSCGCIWICVDPATLKWLQSQGRQ